MAGPASIKRNIVANFIANIWMALVSLALVPFYIRFLGIESYGLIGVFATLQAMSSMLDFGFTITINREMAGMSVREKGADEARDLLRTLEVVYWSIAVLIGVVIVLLSTVLADHWITSVGLSRNTVRWAIILIGVVVAVQWPFSFYAGGLLGLQRQVLLSGINVAVATTRGCGAILLLWLVSPTIHAFFAWQVIISLVSTILVAWFLWANLSQSCRRPTFQIAQLRRVLRFSAGVSGVSILGLVLLQEDKIILSKLLSLENFGYYTLAGVITASLYMLINPVYNAVFPRITQLVAAGDQTGLVEFYHKSSGTMAVLIVSATAVLALFSRQIIWVWTGNADTAARVCWLVTLLAIGTGLYGLVHVPWAVQLAYGWTRLGLYQNLAAIIVLTPLAILLVVLYGAIGGAVAWLVVNIMYITVGQAVMHRRVLKGELKRWYFDDVGRVAVVAFIVAGVARYFVPHDWARVWLLLFLLGVSLGTLGITALATPTIRNGFLNYWMNARRVRSLAGLANERIP